MLDRIIDETRFLGSINSLLIIYGFGDDFLIGRDWYTKFYLKVGEK